MPEIVRAALVQTAWTGDKESMIARNVELAREAAADGAQVLCFQELFYSPYFCSEQDERHFSLTEAVPDEGLVWWYRAWVAVYLGVTVYGYSMDSELEFYGLAVVIGLVQGGVQALSRALGR